MDEPIRPELDREELATIIASLSMRAWLADQDTRKRSLSEAERAMAGRRRDYASALQKKLEALR